MHQHPREKLRKRKTFTTYKILIPDLSFFIFQRDWNGFPGKLNALFALHHNGGKATCLRENTQPRFPEGVICFTQKQDTSPWQGGRREGEGDHKSRVHQINL